MDRKASFEPVVSPDTRVLVLGSLPGDRSLAEQRYYAHPRNQFWHLVGLAIGSDLVFLDYPDRLQALLEGGIGLWDSVRTARRSGSLDARLGDVEPNALAELASSLPQLKAIAFNGKAACRIGKPECAGLDLPLLPLPSSSPAYAAMPLREKERQWLQLRGFLR